MRPACCSEIGVLGREGETAARREGAKAAKEA
jgi:hypothetical protein